MRVWSIVMLLSLAVEASSPSQGRITSFNLEAQGGIVTAATFDGSGPYRVLLDTGANHSSISDRLARALGAPVIARGEVSSQAGVREYPIVRVDRMSVGPITVGATPSVVPAGDLAGAGAIDGVLGQDVLANLRYTIDYRRRHVVWEDSDSIPTPSPSESALPLTFVSGLPMVELRHGSSFLQLVADSGAGGLLLFQSAGRTLPAMKPGGGLVRIDSFQGSRMARRMVIDELRIGPSLFQDLPVVVIESSNSPASAGDGLLPLHIFGRVTFDGPGRRLILG
ncbi:MAG TPA: aspartyl protease family protein [Vicinamibacterales bacterium]